MSVLRGGAPREGDETPARLMRHHCRSALGDRPGHDDPVSGRYKTGTLTNRKPGARSRPRQRIRPMKPRPPCCQKPLGSRGGIEGRCEYFLERHRNRLLTPSRRKPGPPHSITSSARASRVGGTVMLIARAVLRLITSSNLMACSTGMSAGFSPRKILCTKVATRRNSAGPSAP